MVLNVLLLYLQGTKPETAWHLEDVGTCFIVFQFSWHKDGCIGVKSLASPWWAFSKLSILDLRCLTIVIKSFGSDCLRDWVTIEGTDR